MKTISISIPEGDSKIIFEDHFLFAIGAHMTTCVIKTPHKVIAGAAVKNPKDTYNCITGYKLAFSRALEQLYPKVRVPESNSVPDDELNRLYQQYKRNKEMREMIWHCFLQELPKVVTT